VIGVREGNLYRLQGEPVQALVHSSDSLCKLWYKRMGHLHQKVLPTNRPDFSIEQQGVCIVCKHAKVVFPSSEHKSKEILDLVYLDVCGPMSVASITGSMYYVSFIVDFSRKTWIYILKTKDEVFSMFREFKALVENQTRKKIKVLRSNNGGEYTSKEFEGFCKEVEIKREMVVLYNPQHNGVAE
jgi:hypothetical protein